MVTVEPPPVVGATTDDDTICEGLMTTLHATGAAFYLWSPTSGLNNPVLANPTAAPTVTTVYTVTGSSQLGCEDTGMVLLTVLPAPNVVASAGDDTICDGSSTPLTASGAISYSWLPTDGLSDPGIANPIASPTSTTNYTVTGVDAAGCHRAVGVTIVVVDCSGIDESAIVAKLYPNPASDWVFVEAPEGRPLLSVELFDSQGSSRARSRIAAIGVGGLPPGLYLAKLTGADWLQWRPVVIQ
jgi:hypothetical protein